MFDWGGGFSGGGSPSLSNLTDYGSYGSYDWLGGGSPSIENVDQSGFGGSAGGGFLNRLKGFGKSFQQGGGGAGGEDPSLAGIPGAEDKIGAEVTAPQRRYQAKLIALAPQAIGIGSSIGPVASRTNPTGGGAAMVNAMARERLGATEMLDTAQMGKLERQYRSTMAEGTLAHNATVIIRRLLSEYFTAGQG